MNQWQWGSWNEPLILTWPEVRSVLLAIAIIGTIAVVRYGLPGGWFADGKK